ncbi:hypothetical protein SKAU_G00035300 [Synaphobranchus kaupii]|uniref:Uncharacterized protein n=1 Tax=Synaphobranchus kaupii TaxID=118154 RepID=A0A9Q1JGI3_SYNKA|nr:hypothetical protein SKAU_G00035300 [Synaphobranchus kaupii]
MPSDPAQICAALCSRQPLLMRCGDSQGVWGRAVGQDAVTSRGFASHIPLIRNAPSPGSLRGDSVPCSLCINSASQTASVDRRADGQLGAE